MSTEIRRYQLKARAESQRETRDRIARAAAELHEEIGVARTTVAEIARRAGVTRVTVYNHFPDLDALLPACAAHYETLHPAPDLAPALEVAEPTDRVAAVLTRLFAWYRETAPLFSKALSDRVTVPELDRFLGAGIDRMQDELVAGLAQSPGLAGEDARPLLRLAVDFWSWHRLTGDGLDDDAAARLLARTVVCACA